MSKKKRTVADREGGRRRDRRQYEQEVGDQSEAGGGFERANPEALAERRRQQQKTKIVKKRNDDDEQNDDRQFSPSLTEASISHEQNNTNNNMSMVDENSELLNLWFSDELVQHVIGELQNENNNYESLVAAFNSLHGLVGQNYSSLLEEMKASNFNTTNGLLLKKLKGGILDIAVLEKMLNEQSKNNNKDDAAENSATRLLLGALCFLNAFSKTKPAISKPNVNAESVSETSPYSYFAILCLRTTGFDIDDVSEHFTSLMNSTITKYNEIKQRNHESVSIMTRIKQRHDELKQFHQEIVTDLKSCPNENQTNESSANATDSAQVVAQAKLLEGANCYFSCSSSALPTCGKRFTHAPAALRGQFVAVKDHNSTTADTTPYFADRVNIVAGPSGSGKTISTLLAACAADPSAPIFNILIHVGIDCCKTRDVSQEKGNRNLETTRELLRGILCSLGLANCDDVSTMLPDTHNDIEMWLKFHEIMKTQLLTNSNVRRHGVVRIVVDEIGKRSSFLRGLCSVWSEIRSKLARAFRLNSNFLELFAVGTGTECFQMSPPGSMPTNYQLFTISKKVMFDELFESFQKTFRATSGLVQKLYKILVTDAARQTDPIVKAIIRMSSNARCGAIILSFIDETARNCRTLFDGNVDASAWTFDQVRSVIAGWCPLIAAAFASKNGLSVYSSNTNGLKSALGHAISFALNRDLQLVELPNAVPKNDLAQFLAAVGSQAFKDQTKVVWEQYGVRFGLLYDTARRISKIAFAGPVAADFDVVYGVDGENNRTGTVEYYYIVEKGQPRFMIDEAFVTMFLFLTQSTSTGVFSIPHPSIDLLFEEANWDFARVAAQFGKRVSVDKIDEFRVDGITRKFTPPHLLYGLGAKKVYSMHLENRLEEKAFELKVLPQELSESAEFWKTVIRDEDAACVLLNGDSAEGADMIVLSKNRIVMTQCKNTFKVEKSKVDKELTNMKREKLLTFLCSIVAEDPSAPIEVFYVIAGREAISFTPAAFSENKAKIERHLSVGPNSAAHYRLDESVHATHAGMTDVQSTVPPFYPILQSAFQCKKDQNQLKTYTMIQSFLRESADTDQDVLETSIAPTSVKKRQEEVVEEEVAED